MTCNPPTWYLFPALPLTAPPLSAPALTAPWYLFPAPPPPAHNMPASSLQVLEDISKRVAMLKQRPTALDEYMAYQVCALAGNDFVLACCVFVAGHPFACLHFCAPLLTDAGAPQQPCPSAYTVHPSCFPSFRFFLHAQTCPQHMRALIDTKLHCMRTPLKPSLSRSCTSGKLMRRRKSFRPPPGWMTCMTCWQRMNTRCGSASAQFLSQWAEAFRLELELGILLAGLRALVLAWPLA